MKNFKLFIYLSLILSSISCSEDSSVSVFHYNSSIDGDEIFGNDLSKFFKPSKYIEKIRIEYDGDILKEIEKLKDKFELTPNFPELELNEAYYSFAFIFNKDTLYAHPSFSSWRYKNKIIEYSKGKFFEDKLKRHRNVSN